jgi:cytochrome c oxidase cbb3-type subunit 3
MIIPFQHINMKKISSLGLMLCSALGVFAKGGGKAPTTGSETNWLEMLLIFTAVVLLLVIWGLGQTVLTLSRQVMEKRKSASKLPAIMLILGSSLLGMQATAQAVTEQTAETLSEAPNYGGLSALEFWALASVIAVEGLVIFFLAFMARRLYREYTGEADAALSKAGEPSALRSWWSELDKKWMTRAVPVEREADVLLDHNYDGIRELDNALPPWWKWGFYITIVLGVVYLFNFHVFGTGKNPEQEYATEMAEGKRQEELYKARTKDLIDENNITLADADGIAAGKVLFNQSCVACHAADGGGGIGPNLTDDYWIHGGAMNDIYKTIKLGYPDKGMQSWQALYSPVQMKNLSSYIKSLKGTKPANPKAPQGDPYQESVAPATPSASAAATPADSSAAEKK